MMPGSTRLIARNLAESGVWAFIPGTPSAGSTSPLWSAILAVGDLAGLGPYVWTFVLGWMALWAIGLLGSAMFEQLCPERAAWGVWVGVFLALEWHLAWYAGSGMETLLYGVVVLATLLVVLRAGSDGKAWLGAGSLIGLITWLRPDGITLLGPVVFVLAMGKRGWRGKVSGMAWVLGGFMALFLPYLGFNRWIAGAWWPNTLYAKQAEYAELRQLPFMWRLWRESILPLEGPGMALLPGFLVVMVEGIRARRWTWVAVVLWVCGTVGLYAWRLPVNYQNGRYVVPMMPVFFVLGLAGMLGSGWFWKPGRWSWVVRIGWTWVLILVTVGTWIIGARAYGQDVALIEEEMVTTAEWLAVHTPGDALIGVHDIGAVGYFSQREVIDLAGLISPEVIPFIRDQEKLAALLDEKRANYLVTFPGWYPDLSRQGELVYQTSGRVSRSRGGENMAVYRWRSSGP